MYPPPYHNPVMLSGEWKGWLEAALNTIRNLDVISTFTRDSGTETLGASWTELFEITKTTTNKNACLSVAIGNYDPQCAGSGEVVFLCNFNNDGTSNFEDEAGHTITAYGNATQNDDQVKFGLSSGYFDGSVFTETVVSTKTEDFNLGSNCTIEFFYYHDTTASATERVVCIHTENAFQASDASIVFEWSSSGTVLRVTGFGLSGLEAISVSAGWHHYAMCLVDDYSYFYMDGVLVEERGGGEWGGWPGSELIISVGAFRSLHFSSSYCTGYLDDVRVIKGAAIYTDEFDPPDEELTMVVGGSLLQAKLRVNVNGNAVETVDYPSIGRQIFYLSGLQNGDVITAEASYKAVDVDWWYSYEESSSGVETGGKVKYPAPEYLNDDPRWIGRWTDIYRLLLAAEGRTPGHRKDLASDLNSTDSYFYVATNTDTICTVTVETETQTVRVECFSRSLFTAFELHKDGVKVADLSLFTQRGDPCAFSDSTVCHDIVPVDVSEGSHTFTLKGVATTTESGHMEAQLHVIY